MTKLEKSPCLELKYEWKMEDININEPMLYSRKFLYEKTDLFQAGMKMASTHLPSNPAILFFVTTNLHKMGLKVETVSYMIRERQTPLFRTWNTIEMEEKNLMTGEYDNEAYENGEAGGIQLFTAPVKLFENNVEPSHFTFKFTVSLTGIVDNYLVHQVDDLLSQQLWSSIIATGTDFKLIASDGNSLPVHKWVLSARSPVFATLFSSGEEIESIHLAVDCTMGKMKQFIQFIYTGALEGLVSRKLLKLAVKYQIKTLEDLCKTAYQDVYTFTMEKMAMFALHLDCGTNLLCNDGFE